MHRIYETEEAARLISSWIFSGVFFMAEEDIIFFLSVLLSSWFPIFPDAAGRVLNIVRSMVCVV